MPSEHPAPGYVAGETNAEKQRRVVQLLKWSAWRKLGGSCARCKTEDHRVFQVDHIDGGGNEHRRKNTTNMHSVYREVLKNTHRYQLLCANCHQIKTLYPDEF